MKTIRIDNIECRVYCEPLSKRRDTVYEIVKWQDRSCYVIAWLKMSQEDVYLQSIGKRILDLSEAELKTFMEVYKMADGKLRQKLQLQNIMRDDEKDGLYE